MTDPLRGRVSVSVGRLARLTDDTQQNIRKLLREGVLQGPAVNPELVWAESARAVYYPRQGEVQNEPESLPPRLREIADRVVRGRW